MDSVIAPLTPTHGSIFFFFFAFLSSTDSRLFNGYAIPFLGVICDVGHRADVSVRYKRRCTDSYFAAKVLLDLVERSFVRSIFLSVVVSI